MEIKKRFPNSLRLDYHGSTHQNKEQNEPSKAHLLHILEANPSIRKD